VVAPDYPGFGQSSMLDHTKFTYTFENFTNIVEKFIEQLGVGKLSLYVMDYGAPVGYRLALRRPDQVQALIVQNGNAYDEGLREFWDPIKKYWADARPENRQRFTFWSMRSQRDGSMKMVWLTPPCWIQQRGWSTKSAWIAREIERSKWICSTITGRMCRYIPNSRRSFGSISRGL